MKMRLRVAAAVSSVALCLCAPWGYLAGAEARGQERVVVRGPSAAGAPWRIDALDPSDWAALERASFGASPVDARAMARVGRSAWLRGQTTYVGDACLSPEGAARVRALPYSKYDPMERAAEAARAQRRARESGSEEELKKAQRDFRREPVSQAFERRAIRALGCDHPLQERMADFWMNHFNVFAGKARVALFLPDFEEAAVRPRMFGKFEDLLWATMTHPAMLEYLDNASNEKGRVNENYARELMELHTLGVDGGYSQRDVQELARALTGLGVVRPMAEERGAGARSSASAGVERGASGFVFDPRRHDQGEKTVLGARYPAGGGLEEARAVARALARHPSTARFLSREMARYFLGDEPPAEAVEELRAAFERSGGDLGEVSRALVGSAAFSRPVLGKFKEPQAWVFSALRLQYPGEEPANMRLVQKWIADLGQPVYYKLTPEGYGSRASDWASADQMGKRFESAKRIAGGAGALFAPAPAEGEERSEASERARKEAARGHPRDPDALWGMLPRLRSLGLEAALKEAAGETERRALVLASPEFMKR